MTDANSSSAGPGVGYAYEDRRPIDAILEALAEATDGGLTEHGPLYDVVDPDALDAAMAHGGPVRTEFTYGTHEVVVTPGRVYVRSIEDA